MVPDVVVDIGNTRLKWGRCQDGAITGMAALPDDPDAWATRVAEWDLRPGARWLLTGVHPKRLDRFAAWLELASMNATILNDPRILPLEVKLDNPASVGIDRLLNAVGAKTQMSDGRGAIIVSGGTAVVVDVLDEEGAFLGGAILPGLRLMALALREHTALLPFVEVRDIVLPTPGRDTHDAIAVGICWSVLGGVRAIIEEFIADPMQPPHIFLTGGDAEFLKPVHPDAIVWPDLTLEGILASAGALP